MVIKVLNLDKCINRFGDISDIDIMPIIREGARDVQTTARDIVPVDTGMLKASISVKHYIRQLTSVVYTLVSYGPFVEFGTRFMRAQPFMVPAFNMNKNPIRKKIQEFIKQEIRLRV